MKILTIVGARPQFVKAAVVSRVIRERSGIEELLVHTGQHFDANMSDVFFQEMNIPHLAINLDINSMSHGAMTARMMEKLEEVAIREKPDLFLIYGDTNSTLAGALVASKLHIPIGHVEAGLRSFNMKMPEEINRILSDRVSKWLFCPTQTAVDNLHREGYDNFQSQISLSGDVMYDAALYYSSRLDEVPSKVEMPDKSYALVTLHREENTDDEGTLRRLMGILENMDEEVVLPLHPRTRKKLEGFGITPRIKTIDPVGYYDMIRLLKNCSFVLTDSGGLQKEAFFFEKFCITLREQTEWVELVDNGVNFICGSDADKVKKALDQIRHTPFPKDLQLYGDGKAGEKIIDVLGA